MSFSKKEFNTKGLSKTKVLKRVYVNGKLDNSMTAEMPFSITNMKKVQNQDKKYGYNTRLSTEYDYKKGRKKVKSYSVAFDGFGGKKIKWFYSELPNSSKSKKGRY